MPKLKQPSLLCDIAVKILAKNVAEYCVRLVDRVNTANLHQDLNAMKLQVCNSIPAPYFEKFIVIMLQEMSKILGNKLKWIPVNHIDSLLDIITDARFKELKSFPQVSVSLLFGLHRNLAKLNGLEIVDVLTIYKFGGTANNTRHCMTALTRMKNLTTLTFTTNCTDEILEAIGQSCFQLRYLDVSSSYVTDRGICSMRRCSQLKTVEFQNTKVTSIGFLELLSTHPNIHDLGHFHGLHNTCSRQVLEGIPSENKCLRHFHLLMVFEVDLVLLTMKCPNLKSAVITGISYQDLFDRELPIPAEFHKLEKLVCQSQIFVSVFVPFLSFDRLRMTTLDFGWQVDPLCSLNESDFYLVCRTCPNLKYIKFHYTDYSNGYQLVIPNLPELESLEIRTWPKLIPGRKKLKLNKMESLKILHYIGFRIPTRQKISVIKDFDNFPQLSQFITDDISIIDIDADIMGIAKDHNLDFTIKIIE